MAGSSDQIYFTENKKREVMDELVRGLLEAHEQGEIDYFQLKDSATYILSHIDAIKTKDQYTEFLKNLGSYWKVFKKLSERELKNASAQREQEIISKLAGYIKHLPKH